MGEKLIKVDGDSVHDEEKIGLSIKDARHDLINPFLSSGKNIHERILSPELKPLGEKKMHFRDGYSRREVLLVDAAVESEQIVKAELENKEEETVRKAEKFDENFKGCENKANNLVEKFEKTVDNLKEPEEIIEDVVESREEVVKSLRESEESVPFFQVQEIKGMLEDSFEEEIVLQKLTFDNVENLFSEETEEVLAPEELEKADIALEREGAEAVWQQRKDERGVPAEEIDGNTKSRNYSEKAAMVESQSDVFVRRNRIITSSVSKGFGHGRQEEKNKKIFDRGVILKTNGKKEM